MLRRLLRLTWSYRWRCIVVFSYQVALLALGILGLSLTGLAIDVVRKALMPDSPNPPWPLALAPPSSWSVNTVIAALGAAVLVMAALRAVLNYVYAVQVAHLVQMEVVPRLRAQVYEKLQRLSFQFFDAHASGGLINRVTGDVQSLRSFIDGVLIQGGIMLLSLLVYVVYMLLKNPELAAVALLPTPLLWLFTARFSGRVQPAYQKNRAEVDALVLGFSEGIEGIQVIKLFAAEAREHARFVAKSRQVLTGQQQIFRDVSRFSALIDGVSHASLVLLLLFGGYQVLHQRLTLGDLVVFAGLLQQFAAQVSRASGIVNTLQQSLTGARRVYEVLDARSDLRESSVPRAIPSGPLELRLENVQLAYGSAAPVLRELDLVVPAGRRVAIVGETGSGKSSLLSLLPRFYDPQQGRVLVSGVDVRDVEINALRRRMGVVFQSNLLFKGTVAGNIAFGHPEASRAQIERAARAARAHDFISQLPHGYDTEVEEAAANLSGGQKQRIALARALLLEPPVLLLDDPTSGIDATTERELLDALESATLSRTTLIATHRLSLARRADQIVVLEAGKIVASGSHEQLLAESARYRRLAELQDFASDV